MVCAFPFIFVREQTLLSSSRLMTDSCRLSDLLSLPLSLSCEGRRGGPGCPSHFSPFSLKAILNLSPFSPLRSFEAFCCIHPGSVEFDRRSFEQVDLICGMISLAVPFPNRIIILYETVSHLKRPQAAYPSLGLTRAGWMQYMTFGDKHIISVYVSRPIHEQGIRKVHMFIS